jgi:hypothetical protein
VFRFSSGFSHTIYRTIAELRLREKANDGQFGELIAKRYGKKILLIYNDDVQNYAMKNEITYR